MVLDRQMRQQHQEHLQSRCGGCLSTTTAWVTSPMRWSFYLLLNFEFLQVITWHIYCMRCRRFNPCPWDRTDDTSHTTTTLTNVWWRWGCIRLTRWTHSTSIGHWSQHLWRGGVLRRIPSTCRRARSPSHCRYKRYANLFGCLIIFFLTRGLCKLY